jgi:hypothetical protein
VYFRFLLSSAAKFIRDLSIKLRVPPIRRKGVDAGCGMEGSVCKEYIYSGGVCVLLRCRVTVRYMYCEFKSIR